MSTLLIKMTKEEKIPVNMTNCAIRDLKFDIHLAFWMFYLKISLEAISNDAAVQ